MENMEMAKFQLAKLRLLLEWGFQVIPADAAAGVDKRGLFSWKRTEGFVNTQGKKKVLELVTIFWEFAGRFSCYFSFFTLIFFAITTLLELESGCSLQECWNPGGLLAE